MKTDSTQTFLHFRPVVLFFFLLTLLVSPLAGQVVLLNNDVFLGDILEGEDMTNFFLISNASPHPVRVERVRSTCGCTVFQFVTNTLLPGERMAVSFVFISRGYSGSVSRSLIVQAGGAVEHYRFTVNVSHPVMFTNDRQLFQRFDMGQISPSRGYTQTIILKIHERITKAAIQSVEYNTDTWECAYSPEPDEKGFFLFLLRLKPESLKNPRRIQERIRMTVDFGGVRAPLTPMAYFVGEIVP